MKPFLIFLTLFTSLQLFADVKGTGSRLDFDVDNDGVSDATLTQTGLGLGLGTASPSTNLHVVGSGLFSECTLTVGQSTTASANFSVTGTMGLSHESFSSSNVLLSDDSVALIDTSSGNVNVKLPNPALYTGRFYTIKKVDSSNKVIIHDLELNDRYTLSSGNLGSLTIVSNGNQWYTLDSSSDLVAYNPISSANLVLHLRFDQVQSDGTFKDDGLHALHATPSSTLSSANLVLGSSSRAIHYENNTPEADMYVDIPDHASLQDESITIAGWTRGEGLSWGINLFAQQKDGDQGYVLHASGSDGALRMRLATDVNSGSGDDDWSASGTTNLRDGNWYHFAATLEADGDADGGGTYKLFVNGVQEQSLTWQGNTELGTTLNWTRVMDHPFSTATSLCTAIDDIRVYDATLTTSEIAALASLPQIRSITAQDNLIVWWKFDGCEDSDPMPDASGTGNDAEINPSDNEFDFVDGVYYNAVSLDDSNNSKGWAYRTLDNSTLSTNSLTAGLWVKASSRARDGNNWNTLFGKTTFINGFQIDHGNNYDIR